MAIAHVQSITASSLGSTPVQCTLNGVTTGNFLTAMISVWEGTADHTPDSVGDGGNTWTQAVWRVNDAGGDAGGVGIYSAQAASGGNRTLSTGWSTTGGGPGVEQTFSEWSGIATTGALDQTASNGSPGSGSNSPTSGTTGTTAQADELVLAALEVSEALTDVGIDAATTGYTNLLLNQNANATIGASHDYKIVSATGAQSASWGTLGGSYNWSGCIATFLAAASGAAAPAVAARATGRTSTTNTTSHAITLPTGISAGNLLVVVFSTDGAPTVSINTGVSGNNWNILGQASNGTIVTGAVVWKIAEGSDALTLTTSAAEQSSHVSLRITGHKATGPVSGSNANGSSTNSNPPNHAPVAGSRNYLWIATRSGDSTVVATAAPADFTNLQTIAAAGTGGASTNTAERVFEGSSLDPGAFTSNSEQWVSWTLAIEPPTGPQTYNETISDSVATSDSFGAGVVMAATISDGVTTSDGFGGTAQFQTSVSDSVTPGDAMSAERAVNATFSDGVSATDDMASSMVMVSAFAEASALGDAMQPSLQVHVAISDAVAPGDSFAQSVAFGVTVAETVETTDAFAAGTVMGVAISDGVTAGDSFTGDIEGGGGDPWAQIGSILRDVPDDVLMENPAELLRLLRRLTRNRRR